MGCINLEICTDTEELLPQIVDNLNDPVQFILDMDEYMADEGFTLDLIKRLAETMAKEYETNSEFLTGKVVEHEFGGGDEPPHPSLKWSAEDLKNNDEAREAMKEIIAIITKLTY